MADISQIQARIKLPTTYKNAINTKLKVENPQKVVDSLQMWLMS